MAKVQLVNVAVLDNPSPFLNPFQFEVTFECIEELKEGASSNFISTINRAKLSILYPVESTIGSVWILVSFLGYLCNANDTRSYERIWSLIGLIFNTYNYRKNKIY